ncbi:MAG: tRNA (adenosine(37)-N6)-threonylcarbamoyltransferase complex ATPase subunit type 1 TsaE [Clostridiales bacterium]|nr:tRNA (adenosine(37)-N6)-threonylcarbamoyltransferase complex ATPase subunit type 1 TsaE [Clostridiales bacterium]
MLYTSENERRTREIGKKLGERLRGGEIVTLSGDLGAGKTVFAKGLAQGLGVADPVVSPTFTLMNEYDGRIKLYHYDAYRLRSATEADAAGLTEYFGDTNGVCVIEWWQNIAEALYGYKKIHVNIRKTGEETRNIEIVDE